MGTAIDYRLNQNLSENFSTLILPERILVDVTILAISPRISMLLGTALLLVSPNPLRLFPQIPTLLIDSYLSGFQYLPVVDFLNRFLLVECGRPLRRRRLISERVNLCSGEMNLGGKFSPRGVFSNNLSSTCWCSPLLSCCPYVRIPSAGQSGSLGVKRGF